MLRVLLLAAGVAAISENSVGLYDWVLPGLGNPTHLSVFGSHLMVGTERGVLASVTPSTGEIVWRRVPEAESPIRKMRVGTRLVTSVADGVTAKFWKAASGHLIWQNDGTDVLEMLPVPSSTGADAASSFEDIITIKSSSITARSAKGHRLWGVSSGQLFPAPVSILGAAFADKVVYVVAADKATGRELSFASVSTQEGEVVRTGKLNVTLDESGSPVRVAGRYAAVTSGRKLIVVDLQSNTKAVETCHGNGDKPLTFLEESGVDGVFGVTDGAKTWVLRMAGKKETLDTLTELPGVHSIGAIHSDKKGSDLLSLASHDKDGLIVNTLDVKSSVLSPLLTIPSYKLSEHGRVLRVLAAPNGFESGKTSPAAFVVGEDHSLSLVNKQGIVWVREEGQASIHASKFAKKPITKEEVKLGVVQKFLRMDFSITSDEVMSSFYGLISGVKDVLLGAEGTPPTATPANDKQIAPIIPKSDMMMRFGGQQVIVAASCAGKIYGIDTLTGVGLWSRFFPGTSYMGAFCSPKKKGLLDHASTPIQMDLVDAPQGHGESDLLIVLRYEDGSRELLWLNPLTGAEIRAPTTLPDGVITHIVPLGQRTALVVGEEKISVVPNTAEARRFASEHLTASPVYLYHVNREARNIEGFRLVPSRSGDAPVKQFAWVQDLTHEERLIDATPVSHNARNGAPVLVKGDSSILYRYLDPNLLVVVAERGATMSLYFIGTIAGNLIQTFEVTGASEPVHVAAADNSVVMHYWSMANTRFELVVVELFANVPDPGAWSVAFGQHNHTRSAYDYALSARPLVASQNHVYPFGVTAVGVTSTKNGITPRSFLYATVANRIHSLGATTINPRKQPNKAGMPPELASTYQATIDRAVTPTKNEMIQPYRGIIMPNPMTDYLTTIHQVYHTRGIETSPSGMESTSLAFSYGLDTFFNIVQPAGGYDILSPDFNAPLLLLSGVGTFLALLFAESYYAKQSIQDRWA